MHDRLHAIIVGGGLVGLTIGLALARHGLSVVIVERADPAALATAGHDARASAIASASSRMLRALGVGDLFDAHAQPIHAIEVTDQGRPPVVRFDAGADDALGWMVENRLLRVALADAARAAGAEIIAPMDIASVARGPAAATVTLAGGRALTAEVVIAADGRASPLREAAGIRVARWDYPQRALVTTVGHTRAHHGVAHEVFYTSGPLALLPMRDDEHGPRSAIVWTRDGRDADGLAKLGHRGLSDALTRVAERQLGAVHARHGAAVYPLALHHAERYHADRLILVGDAAHGIHPIAGQGLNMGLRDVAALAQVMVDAARTGIDLGAVGADYERWRRLDNAMVASATDGLNRLFALPGRLPAFARRAGLVVVARSGTMQRFFMSEARGERGDLPALLRGELV